MQLFFTAKDGPKKSKHVKARTEIITDIYCKLLNSMHRIATNRLSYKKGNATLSNKKITFNKTCVKVTGTTVTHQHGRQPRPSYNVLERLLFGNKRAFQIPLLDKMFMFHHTVLLFINTAYKFLSLSLKMQVKPCNLKNTTENTVDKLVT
jgi:hypothetical protein